MVASHNFFLIYVIDIFRPVLVTLILLKIGIFVGRIFRRFRIAFANFLDVGLFQANFCIVIRILPMMRRFRHFIDRRNLQIFLIFEHVILKMHFIMRLVAGVVGVHHRVVRDAVMRF